MHDWISNLSYVTLAPSDDVLDTAPLQITGNSNPNAVIRYPLHFIDNVFVDARVRYPNFLIKDALCNTVHDDEYFEQFRDGLHSAEALSAITADLETQACFF